MKGLKVFLAIVIGCLVLSCNASLVNDIPLAGSWYGEAMDGEAGQVQVQVVLGDLGSARTIAPTLLTAAELNDPRRYTLLLEGRSDMGDTRSFPSFTIGTDGLGVLLLSPGNWELTMTVTAVAGNKQILMGKSSVKVENKPTVTAMVLIPLTGNGTVAVNFELSTSIMERLDKDTATQEATIAVSLYDATGTEVQGTKTEFKKTVPTNGATTTLNYTANAMQLPSGRYNIKLVSSYTVNTPSTLNMDAKYTMGYEDVLYVESSRVSSATVALTSNSKDLGVPENPYRRDKYNLSGSTNARNFAQTETFNPWGETLWAGAGNWDGENSGTSNGNEVLALFWDPVLGADFYEIEFLIYPFLRMVGGQTSSGGGNTTVNGKLPKPARNDAEWDALKQQTFSYGGNVRTPSYLRFSGDPNDPNYYRTYYSTIEFDGTGRGDDFLTCVDKTLCRQIFLNAAIRDGKGNSSYRVQAATNTVWDTYGKLSNRKIGLEGDCGALGILLPSFAPRSSLVFRVRGVNAYGYSDWVYWKGGIG